MPPAPTLPVPPQELMNRLSGPGTEDDFRAVMRVFRRLFVEQGGLKPTDRVLEVGSGIGRMAQAVADYLTPPGQYDGLEIAPDGVKWCADTITPVLPHFRFHHADVYNSVYNPTARRRARVYRFPFADGTFDFAFLTSVFTHLLPRDAAHYLGELARVLKPGGRLFATFFLFNAERVKLVRTGTGVFHQLLRYGQGQLTGPTPAPGDCFVHDPNSPEAAVGYEEKWIGDQLRECGLTPDATTYYGDWDGRPSAYDGQDVVCGTKTGGPSLGRRVKGVMRLDGLREWVWRRRMGR